MKTFENYLKDIHAKDYDGPYAHDGISDAFDAWLTELTPDDMIRYADELLEKKEKILEKQMLLLVETTVLLRKVKELV